MKQEHLDTHKMVVMELGKFTTSMLMQYLRVKSKNAIQKRTNSQL